MRKTLGTLAVTGALFLAPAAIASADTSSPAPAASSADTSSSAPADTSADTSADTNPVNVDDTSDKTGLWGLLGLLGLAGLIRRTPDRSNDYATSQGDVRR